MRIGPSAASVTLYFAMLSIALSGCRSTALQSVEIPLESEYTILAPPRITSGKTLPVIVQRKNNNPRLPTGEIVYLKPYEGIVVPDHITVKHGWGSASLQLTASGYIAVDLESAQGTQLGTFEVFVESLPDYRDIGGTLYDSNLHWDSTEVYHVAADITVPDGLTLTMAAGTRVEIDPEVSFTIEGNVICYGTEDAPVLITAYDPNQAWGEIFHQDEGTYFYTIFSHGGGDASRAFGHSGSQPVLGGSNCNLELRHSCLVDHPGKALGLEYSEVFMESCLISRCDTGGELKYCLLTALDSYWIDMPNGDGLEIDDDNDALYLDKQLSQSGNSLISDCVFATGKDDGIDHNGAQVMISGCIIDGYDNEGIAASNLNSVIVHNSLIMNCEQGVEAGYGTPIVTVNHCTLVNNDVGLRLGDSYTWGCNGTLTVRNTISVYNTNYNVWNYDLQIEGPREGAVTVSYSLVNEEEYNGGTGCLVGSPNFTEDFLLTPESIGVSAADDGLDMGILADY